MGTFMGHFIPGAFFLVFSIWWTVQLWMRYFNNRRRNQPFRASVTFQCSCLPGRLKRWEVEGALKILFALIGITGEVATGIEHGYFYHTGNLQHITMFAFFGIGGFLDMLVHHRVNLPKNINYFANMMAFAVEALLFSFHLHVTDELEVIVHKLLIYTIYGCVVALAVEMYFNHSMLAVMVRTLLTLVQGTWFIQLAFVLYPPFSYLPVWSSQSHSDLMLLTVMYAWHVGIGFFFMLAVGLVVRHCSRNNCSSYDDFAMQSLLGDKSYKNDTHMVLEPVRSDQETDDE